MIKNFFLSLKHRIIEFDYRTLKNMGIGKTLLLWFLAISLVPLATLSYINFFYYYEGLNVMAKKSLFTTAQLRMNYLDSYFQELSDYLEDITRDPETLKNLERIQQDVQKAENEPHPTQAKKDKQHIFRELLLTIEKAYMPEGINDVYFVNTKGKLLFQLNESPELGKDVFSGPLSETEFGKTCKKILFTGKPMFSDLEYFPPEGNELFSFMGRVVYNSSGEKMGVILIKTAYPF